MGFGVFSRSHLFSPKQGMWPVAADGDSDDVPNVGVDIDVTDGRPLLDGSSGNRDRQSDASGAAAAAAGSATSSSSSSTSSSSSSSAKLGAPKRRRPRPRRGSRADLIADASDETAITVDEAMDSFGLGSLLACFFCRFIHPLHVACLVENKLGTVRVRSQSIGLRRVELSHEMICVIL